MNKVLVVGIVCVIVAVAVGGVVILTPTPPPPNPAEFEVFSLTLSPSQAAIGQQVTVSAEIKNVGDEQGTYKATLIVDGVNVEDKEITVAGGGTETVKFFVMKEVEGTYSIEVGGLTKTLQVKGLRMVDLEPTVGDEWQLRFAFENSLVLLLDVQVNNLSSKNIGNRLCGVYVIKGSGDVEGFGAFLPEWYVLSSNLDVYMYYEKDGLSSELLFDMKFVLDLEPTLEMYYTFRSISEVISGTGPDIMQVGGSWNTTERRVEEYTVAYEYSEAYGYIPPETNTIESTSTVNYDCTEIKPVTVEAGTFYCYEVRRTEVGEDYYSLDYYSPKTKLPVKSVVYQGEQITMLVELVSYSVSKDNQGMSLAGFIP